MHRLLASHLRPRCAVLRDPFSFGIRFTSGNSAIGANVVTEAPLKVDVISESRPGDWNCPGCGVLSFSWRTVCFKCGTLKPKAVEIRKVDKKSRNPRDNLKSWQKPKISLKDMLQESDKTRSYDRAVKEALNRLKENKFLKGSVVATIIQTFGKAGQYEKAVEVFDSIGSNRNIKKRPTEYHYSSVITACGNGGMWDKALQILDEMRDTRLKPSSIVYTSAMTACMKSAKYKEAIQIFETLRAEGGCRLDTGICNVAISAYGEVGQYGKAYEVFEEMWESRIKRDERSFGSMMEICAKSGDWVLAQDLLRQLKLKRSTPMNTAICSSAIRAFAKGGKSEEAIQILEEFKALPQKNLLDYPIYSAALLALSTMEKGKGQGMRALGLVQDMARRHIKISPTVVVHTIHALEADGMQLAAEEMYNKAADLKMWEASGAYLNEEGQVDLRRSSPPVARAAIRSIMRSYLTREKDAEGEGGEGQKKDIFILLGIPPPPDHFSFVPMPISFFYPLVVLFSSLLF
jgi:pentatricopeptide repeat protein